MSTLGTRLQTPQSGLSSLREYIAHNLTTIGTWHSRARQRRALAGLSSDLLKDIGVSAEQAAAEARKPFWAA